jgi:plastocyanin
MGSRRRLLSSIVALSSLVAGPLLWADAASGSPQTYVIGVDAAGPVGHNFEYVDYFPRGRVLPTDPQAVVGNGAVLDFRYNFLSLDGLHTATLLPFGETPEQAWTRQPLVSLDEPEPAPKPMFNPDAVYPNLAGCGAASNPCTYTGAGEVNSGAIPGFAFGGGDFYVRLNLAASTPTTVHFVCLVHPGMQGSIRVVPGLGSSPAAFADQAASQLAADTTGALAAENAANGTAVTDNGDGTKTITMTAGTATQFVEIAEMLPRSVTVHQGDKVKWVTTSLKDPHTVTFPDTGTGFSSVDPFEPPWAPPPECEGTPADGAPTCAQPEIPINPAPNVAPGTAITSPAFVATSGIIAPFPPFSDNFTFSFPNAGTFTYECRVHEHMNGTITVAP